MENNVYEDPDFGHPDNSSPCYEQALPEMDTTQRTSYPSPPDYVTVLPEVQPARVAVPPPYHINNTSKGFFPKPAMNTFTGPTYPKEVRVSLPHPTNNLEMFQNANLHPQFLTPQTLEPTAHKMASHQPMLFSSPQSVMIDGVMLPPQHTQNYPGQGPVFFAPQPMVVTNQTTVITSQTPYYRDYLPWSIFNLICCCFIFGIVALIFSVQTRSAKRYQNWESARRKSCTALGFNLAAMLLGIALIIIVPSVYYTQYYSYYYVYYYYG